MSKSTGLSSSTFFCSCISCLLLIETTYSATQSITTTSETTTTSPGSTTLLPTTTTPETTTTPGTTSTTWKTETTTTGTTQSTTMPPFTTTTSESTQPTTSTILVDVLRSLSPNRGPIAGGTKVTFRGQGPIEAISDVYFLNAGSGVTISSTYDSLTVYSPEAQHTGSVTIGLTFNRIFATTNLTFEYRPNPNIDRLEVAPIQLTSGGSLLTVIGTSLDSVVNPQVNVTVVLVQPASCNRCRRAINVMQPYAINSYIGDCTYESSDNMTCVLPDLHLPENFTSKLQDDRENEGNFSTKEPGSVAKLLGPDSSVAYVYLGFIFDGYEKYTNVSDPKSGLQDQLYLNFVPPPVINSSTELITFDPKKEDDIQIKGRSLLDGCSHGVLCEVLVGDGQCRITEVTDNVIMCVPPKEKPRQSTNDSFCNRSQPNSLTIEIHIGFRSYYYKCLDYYFLDVGLIIGLTVGLGVPALIVISVALYFCIRKLRSRKASPTTGGQLPGLEEVDPASFKGPSSSSNLPAFSQDTEPETIYQNRPMRMSMLRRKNENAYQSEIPGDSHLKDDNGEDIYNRETFYPPNYLRSVDNEYQSSINGDRAEDGAYDNSSGPGLVQNTSRHSHFPPSFGKSWGNHDNDVSKISDDSEDRATYANFGELRFDSS